MKGKNYSSLSYSELLRIHSEQERDVLDTIINISVLSNITVNQLTEPLECKLGLSKISCNITFGDYDNIVQGSYRSKNQDVVIIFWESCNIFSNFHFEVEKLEEDEFVELLERVKSEITLVLDNLSTTSLVIFNEFSSSIFDSQQPGNSNYVKFVNCLNQYLRESLVRNVVLIDLTRVFLRIGVEKCVDFRFYYLSRALYTFEFWKAYSAHIEPYILAKTGKSKKALIFDCDNTLWKGILGEDGFNNIDISPESPEGSIFHEVQSIAVKLSQMGTIIGICSKNNITDVQEVMRNHPDHILKEEFIYISKCNWNDKVTNLTEIAKELNVSLESIVFIDDSCFEVEFVRTSLPQVTVIQVPKNIYEYANLVRRHLYLFYKFSITDEDKRKATIYKEQQIREKSKSNFKNIETYLSNLGLRVSAYLNQTSQTERIAQMTQKTNQFNLRTKRYTEQEIENFIASESFYVFTFSVSDRFGDSGISGLCMVKLEDELAFFDTFLLSCRVIGRNVEFKILNYVLTFLKSKGVRYVSAEYIPTNKNDQAANFYDNCLFNLENKSVSCKEYKVDLCEWKSTDVEYIEIEGVEV